MAYTSPKTWAVGELLTAADFNLHIRDNMNALAARASTQIRYLKGSNTTLSTTGAWTDVDAVNLAGTFTPVFSTSAEVKIQVPAGLTGGSGPCYFDVYFNGARIGNATVGLCGANSLLIGIGKVTGLTPRTSHSFKLQYYQPVGTTTLISGASYAVTVLVTEL